MTSESLSSGGAEKEMPGVPLFAAAEDWLPKLVLGFPLKAADAGREIVSSIACHPTCSLGVPVWL